MDDCIFCKIVAGKIPCNKIGESTNFLAFLDIHPISEGHTLIVPKKHSTNMLDLPEYFGEELLEFSQRIAQQVVRAVHAEGFNLGVNNGSAAGQVVFHTHIHIIPRRAGDGLSTWPSMDVTNEMLARTREKIVKE